MMSEIFDQCITAEKTTVGCFFTSPDKLELFKTDDTFSLCLARLCQIQFACLNDCGTFQTTVKKRTTKDFILLLDFL